MIKVQVRPNEPLEAALRRFKRQCNYAGIFRLAKKYTFHEKRSDKNRREERERIRNIQRAQRKQMRGMRRSKRRKSKVKAPRRDEDSTEDNSTNEGLSVAGVTAEKKTPGVSTGESAAGKPVAATTPGTTASND